MTVYETNLKVLLIILRAYKNNKNRRWGGRADPTMERTGQKCRARGADQRVFKNNSVATALFELEDNILFLPCLVYFQLDRFRR